MTTKFQGKVKRLYVDKTTCYVQLKGVDASLDSYFALQADHPNYPALYSLALAAAVNGYLMTVKTLGQVEEANAAKVYPNIHYLVVDW